MANSDDIRIVVEGNDLTISSVDSENITVSVSDYVAFWAEISGKPSDSTALTNYIKSIADGKISTHDLSETAHAFIQQRITNETTARQTADTTLQTNINTEITDRQTAVANEATARANADSAITSNLNTEITNRETADTQLQAAITAEASVRAGADANLQASINTKQDKLTAGSNVQINNNVISATDTTYTAGTGISIVDNVISNTQTSAEWGNITGTLSNQSDLNTALNGKQPTLVSGTNIKTINSQSLLGSGDITISGTGANVVQATGNSTTDVMSQKAVTDTPAFKEVISPTKLLQSSVDQYCTSYYTYTQNQVQNIRVICRQSYNGASVNHYRTGDIKYMSAVGLFKNDNNYLTLYFNGYNLAIRNRKNNVSINEVNLGNFYSALNQPYITSWCAEIDLHNKVIRFLYYNAQTNTMDTFPANTTYDISEWDLSHLDSFNFVYGCSEYTSDSFLYHCYMNGYIDIQEYLSRKINYGEYNSYNVLPKRDITPLIATEVFANTTSSGAIAGTLIQEYSALHKTFSFNMPTGDGVYMGYNVTTTGNRHSGTTWCMKFKILSCDDTFEFAYRTSIQEIWQGDTHIRDIKWSEATWHPDTNIEYTFVTQASDDLPWTDWLLKGRNGNVVMEVLDVWFMIPQNANICAETYDGTFFAGNLPFLATNVKFENDYSSIDTSRQYLGIPRYMKYVNNAGDIYMYNGTTWKKVSP